MENANDRMTGFVPVYNSVISSTDEELTDRLTLFRDTVRDAWKAALENSPADAEELLNRTADLVSTVASREEKLRKTLKNGFLDAQLKQAMYLLGSGSAGNDPLEEHRARYNTGLRDSFARMQTLRELTMDLADELTQKGLLTDCPSFQKLIMACDQALETDTRELEQVTDLPLYLQQVLKFAELEQQVLPGRESAALAGLKQRATELAESKSGSAAKGRETLKRIEEWEAERQKAERVAAYWSAHPEEKAALETEQASLKAENLQVEDKIRALREEAESLPSVQAIRALDERIDGKKKELQALGFFQGKKKRALQAEIDALTKDRSAAWNASQPDRDALEKRLEPLNARAQIIAARLQEIDHKLSLQG